MRKMVPMWRAILAVILASTYSTITMYHLAKAREMELLINR